MLIIPIPIMNTGPLIRAGPIRTDAIYPSFSPTGNSKRDSWHSLFCACSFTSDAQVSLKNECSKEHCARPKTASILDIEKFSTAVNFNSIHELLRMGTFERQ